MWLKTSLHVFTPMRGSAEVRISRGKTDPRSMNPYVHWKTWNSSKCSCTLNGHNPCISRVYSLFKAAVPQVSEKSLQFKHVGGLYRSQWATQLHWIRCILLNRLLNGLKTWIITDLSEAFHCSNQLEQQPWPLALQQYKQKQWTINEPQNICVCSEQCSFRYFNRDSHFHYYYCILWY